MRIHQLECPNCGAPLELKGEASFCFCSYCGKRVVLNEKYAAHRLAERIMGLIEPVEKHNSLKLRLLSANNEEQKLVRAFNQITSIKTDATIIGYSLLTFVMAACIGILGGANRIISVLMAIMAAGAAYYIFRHIYRRKTNNLRRDLRNSTRRCEDIEDHIENIESNYDFSFIPNGYRNREAMMHFYRSLITGRAYNLKQVIVYYDEYLEREEEKQRQEDQIRMQQRQIDELKRMNESNRVTQNSSNDLGPILALGGALLFGTKVLKDIRRFMK